MRQYELHSAAGWTPTPILGHLNSSNLTEDQIEVILGELTASVTHLNAHSKTVKEVIED